MILVPNSNFDIYKVSIWLEELHDRRVLVTEMFNKMKEHMKRKINSIQTVAKIEQLSQLVTNKMELLSKNHKRQQIFRKIKCIS